MSTHLDIVRHYESCFRQHGDCAKGLDWPNESDANTRHQIMWDLIPSGTENFSLIDFGCGTLQFLDYLHKQGKTSLPFSYAGIDLSDVLVESARKKYPTSDVRRLDILNESDFERFPIADYIVSNGVFTVKKDVPNDQMISLFEAITTRLFEKCNKGLAFNLMSKDIVDWEREDLFFRSFSDVASFIKNKLNSRSFVFRQDYGLFEFTTYVYK